MKLYLLFYSAEMCFYYDIQVDPNESYISMC